jgi:hypothetical protein
MSTSYVATANTMNFTTVIKPVPKHLFLSTKISKMLCPLVFGNNIPSSKNFNFLVSSYQNQIKLKSGIRSEEAQGEMFENRETNDLSSVSKASVERLLKDWQENHSYSKEYTDWLRDIHNSLAQERVSIIRVEESNLPPPRNFDFRNVLPNGLSFSMIRIYDSSEVPYIYGSKRVEQKNSNLKSVAEMALGFDLSSVLERAGIERGEHTWSIGLIDSLGGQVAPAKFLFGQVANQLDIHYNGRNYFVRKSVDLIENRDLDIIGYTNERTMKVYEKLFGIHALREAKTKDYIRIRKNDQDFYLFHFKGSDFIEMNFKLEQMYPKYVSNDPSARSGKLQKAESILRLIEDVYFEVEEAYRPATPDLQSFLLHTRSLFQEVMLYWHNPSFTKEDLAIMLAKVHIFHSRIPHNTIKAQLDRLSPEQLLSLLEQVIPYEAGMLNGQNVPVGANPRAAYYSKILVFIEMLMLDPVHTIINKATLNR